MKKNCSNSDVIIVGAGFTGLAAAYDLAKKGIAVTVLESETEAGGLAGAFDVQGQRLDRFYHHWFTSDQEILSLVHELELSYLLKVSPTQTGIYYANKFFKLSTPIDLMQFSVLGMFDRIRLGLMTLFVRRIKDYKTLESMSASEWLKKLYGAKIYTIVWEPLLRGKFGSHANDVSAVWFWNKLKLRGGSRGKGGGEVLAYLEGGFVVLVERLVEKITALGGRVELNCKVKSVKENNGLWIVETSKGTMYAENVIVTTALPILADMIKDWATPDYIHSLYQIKYIGNVCLVLELDRSLSSTYWMNVNDPSFPFVGVIEHTNFEGPENYGGRHIVYLSKYLPHTDPLFKLNSDEYLDYAFPFLTKMFPKMKKNWIIKHHLWRAHWSQPIVGKNYSELIPSRKGPKKGLFICTMAQIYPEDRGTNYAIREGFRVGKLVSENLTN